MIGFFSMSRRNSNGDSSPPAGVSITPYSMQSEFITNASSTLNVPLNDLKLVYDTWPDNFACLFDMGLRAFEKLFSYRPSLKQNFDATSEDAWKRDNRMKKIVLALEQTLAQAVATYADPQPDSSTTPGNFVETHQQIGGLHRAIASRISPDNFDMLFKLLPEVITDTVSARRTSGPLTSEERRRFCNAWVEIAKLMSRHFILGWERRVIPKIPKFAQAYNRYQEESCRIDTGAGPACGSATPITTGPSPCQVGSPSACHTAGAASGSATTGLQSTERRAATRRSDDDTARTIGRRFQHNPKRTKSASANETKPRGFFGPNESPHLRLAPLQKVINGMAMVRQMK
ncbi:hypothetical protein WR25_12542 [Diploscapter pachys]|uniref:Uncharacterized protein n=1 Tax=Diploscapter pachys TaxID=2018661 RepID=A0A2A2JUV6_9BILA|nr:hypothetical protein WR25_12542 [Diploscapter pachys]